MVVTLVNSYDTKKKMNLVHCTIPTDSYKKNRESGSFKP